jgi:hypothetical protein
MHTELKLIAPTAEAEADASAATFTWAAPVFAEVYRLQIARDEAFVDLVFDADIPKTNSITLFDTLRPRDEAYFWRIRPRVGADSGWSATARFRAVSEPRAAVAPASSVTARQAMPPLRATVRPAAPSSAEPAPPYLTETTPAGLSAAVVLIAIGMLIGIALIAAFIPVG